MGNGIVGRFQIDIGGFQFGGLGGQVGVQDFELLLQVSALSASWTIPIIRTTFPALLAMACPWAWMMRAAPLGGTTR